MDSDRQPGWLREPCPGWCARRHTDDDHPEDRFHQSAAIIVPVVGAPATATLAPSALMATELAIWRARHLGATSDWVAVEEVEAAGIHLALSLESAAALAVALEDVAGSQP